MPATTAGRQLSRGSFKRESLYRGAKLELACDKSSAAWSTSRRTWAAETASCCSGSSCLRRSSPSFICPASSESTVSTDCGHLHGRQLSKIRRRRRSPDSTCFGGALQTQTTPESKSRRIRSTKTKDRRGLLGCPRGFADGPCPTLTCQTLPGFAASSSTALSSPGCSRKGYRDWSNSRTRRARQVCCNRK